MTGIEPAKLIAVIIYDLDNALTVEQSSAKFGGECGILTHLITEVQAR